jgi:hypothetical protein
LKEKSHIFFRKVKFVASKRSNEIDILKAKTWEGVYGNSKTVPNHRLNTEPREEAETGKIHGEAGEGGTQST